MRDIFGRLEAEGYDRWGSNVLLKCNLRIGTTAWYLTMSCI
jgi:hypothetical protein